MTDASMRPPLPDDAFGGAASGNGELHPTVSYFGQPLLKKPHWEWNVVLYLFLGGLMGGSGILAALGDGSGNENDRKLARNAKYASLGLAVACPAILITHLGKPERFLNMLRIVKFKSPMSMGVWGLIAFSGVATLNAAAQFFGVRSRLLNWPQAALGAFIAGYTGVLLSATAIPVWSKGKYHVPAMCVASGLSGACALHGLLLAGDAPDTHNRLEKLEFIAAAAEAALILDYQRFAGEYGKPMFQGARGEKFRNVTLVAGIAVPALLHFSALFSKPNPAAKPGLLRSVLAAGLTLVGAYVMRETLIEAGKASADDPSVAFRQPE
ncbi:MAG TPA: NrfD/PsrC family molybdoenzyme membrane anchor subunit [Candidatus Baltobacteraceae bacterium]|jgi:formate-dependent nitrite reductase membrane component NrfD